MKHLSKVFLFNALQGEKKRLAYGKPSLLLWSLEKVVKKCKEMSLLTTTMVNGLMKFLLVVAHDI